MDTNPKDKEPSEIKESAINDAENASFILGTGKLVTPQKHAAGMTPYVHTPDTFKSPLNFSTVTIQQLGITPESFVKSPSEKSSSYLKKSRRRSAVGTRGSPETNHLIRFIAQQRNLKNAKRSPFSHDSPFQGSPGLYRNVNSLKERISAFQSAFHSIKENEKMTDCPEFSEQEFTLYSDLWLNFFIARYCLCNTSNIFGLKQVDLDIFPHLSHVFILGCKVSDWVEGTGSNNAVSPDTLTAEASSNTVLEVKSPTTTVSRRDIPSTETFVLRSVLKKPSGKLFAENLQEHHDNLCDDLIHPSLISDLSNCCKERKADQENFKTPAFLSVRKRKRVTFGEDLSPEVFDESLPANTPLRKGGTPVRQKNLSSGSPLLLEQSPVPEQLPQPNFDDKGENLVSVTKLYVQNITDCPLWDPFFKFFLQQLISFAEENVCNLYNAEPQSCKEKKINRRKSQQTKCRNRVLPKKNQVSKSCRKKKGKGKKSVPKSLYGERDMASKKPLLSPIPELPEFCEMTPLFPNGCSSNGKLEEVRPREIRVKRNSLGPQNPEDLHQQQGLGEPVVCELGHSYVKSSTGPSCATPDEELSTNTVDTEDRGNIPRAENKWESENESKSGTETENSHPSCASVTGEHIVLDHLKPGFVLQCQESAAAGHNAGKLCQVLKISEDVRCEKQEDLVVAARGKPQCRPFMQESHKEFNCLEDVLIGKAKEAECHSDNVGRKAAEISSLMSCREKKHRRRSMYYSDGQSLHLEQNGNHEPSYSVGSSVEISLENSELCKDLSDAIEQTFQKANGKTKVRRSTRLQKDSENEGLVWMSLPCLSTSQKSRRRTICTFDRRGLENLSPVKEALSSRQNPGVVASVSGEESSQGLAAECSRLPGQRRRRSFCAPTATSTHSATEPNRCRKRAFPKRGESLTATSLPVDTEAK
uniref:Cell division cycle associated 2 n=1 Tax=Sciurus vulgaris TaxID=55149 RepID=A0A8D2CLQ2_SCIVU